MSNLVLIGAGHAHLHLIAAAAKLRAEGLKLSLVEPGNLWYSGMASGMLSGRYSPAEDQIDIPALANKYTVPLYPEQAVAVDRVQQQLQLASGRQLPYDLLSINIGSQTRRLSADGNSLETYAAKPISELSALRDRLLLLSQSQNHIRVAVVGGGPTACEIVANLIELAEALAARQVRLSISIIASTKRLADRLPSAASEQIQALFNQAGVDSLLDTKAERLLANGVELANGESLPADIAVLATGLTARQLSINPALPTGLSGGILTTARLHSPADRKIYAVGDCADFAPRPLPKIGVFGVRAGPVLLKNLCAEAQGQLGPEFKPQEHFLSVLNLGRGLGLAYRKRLWWYGRSSLWLKEWLDKRFMQRYR